MQKLTVTLFTLIVFLGSCQKKTEQQATTTTDSSATIADTTVAQVDSAMYSPDNFVIIPGEQVGNIRATSTEKQLVELLGSENVTVHDTIYVGEGNTEPGTTLFKGTPDEVQILWADKEGFAQPDAVIIRPATDKPGTAGTTTQWMLADGLKIGSTLKEVEKLNGKPFSLYGFSWDYGGTVSNWHGGRYQAKDGKTYFSVVFGYGELTPEQEKLSEKVMGDSEFSSSNPTMQQLNPTIQTMTIRFK